MSRQAAADLRCIVVVVTFEVTFKLDGACEHLPSSIEFLLPTHARGGASCFIIAGNDLKSVLCSL